MKWLFIIMVAFTSCEAQVKTKEITMKETNDSLKNKLTEIQYHVTQNCGTEQPFTGAFYDFDETGIYKCVCCGNELFRSETKYKSGTGWPSFYDIIDSSNVLLLTDNSHGMNRTEIKCNKCNAHLGHVFPDGPKPTGLRYCINSASLDFEKP